MHRNYHAAKRRPEKRTPSRIRPAADRKLKRVFDMIGVPAPTPFEPDLFQTEAVSVIEKGDCLVTAPTGSGKTWIALEAIARIREKGGKAWYASPLKALSNSKYFEFIEKFGAANVGILTGDRKENPDAPVIVGTTEILRNQLYDAMHRGESIATDFVILDEAHFLGDEERGVVWEEILIYLPTRIPILMLSATIGNAEQIAGWLSVIRMNPCTVVTESKRPVPLYPLFIHPSGTLYPLLAEEKGGKKKKLHKQVAEYVSSGHPMQFTRPGKLPPFGDILRILRKYQLLPAIFFLKSRADCDHALEMCTRHPIPEGSRKEEISQKIQQYTAQISHLSAHRQLHHLEHLAVGAHHSGQLPAWKLLIEELMTDGLLDAVFATSTVAAGVNFPARTVVFLNSDKFNGTEFLPLGPTEFHQMTGRAGRRGMDKIGFAAVMPGKYMDTRLIAELVGAEPADVLSQIHINFSMTLNLLLSHTAPEIENLLLRSFAAWLLRHQVKKKKKAADTESTAPSALWADFLRHFDFLKETGYVSEDGRLTEDGIWASQLRVDQPLLIAEGFRQQIFPDSDPVLLAAIIASFVNDRETDERISSEIIPNPLKKTFAKIIKGLQDFRNLMAERGFGTHPLYMRPALAVYLWATGLRSWEDVIYISSIAEGDLAMLILRTADHLRHIISLKEVFPKGAQTAAKAVEQILRDPVISGYEG